MALSNVAAYNDSIYRPKVGVTHSCNYFSDGTISDPKIDILGTNTAGTLPTQKASGVQVQV